MKKSVKKSVKQPVEVGVSCSYCGVARPGYNLLPSSDNREECRNIFNPLDAPARTIGEQFLESMHNGVSPDVARDIGYDSEDKVGVDILTSPNHDFFDIAEQVGKLVESPSAVVTEETVSSSGSAETQN